MKLIVVSLITLSSIGIIFIKQNSKTQTDPLKESIERGRDIYTDFCVSCHLPNGKGVEKVYPPLANSDYLKKNREASIRGIKYGQKGKIVVNGQTYDGFMAPMGLSGDEVADVMNYITNSWGNKNDEIITEEDVSKIKK